MGKKPLTTTSYAILGHLALQPWTTYELVAQMRRNVRYFYPRAESQVYEEPKRLAALGLAKVEKVKTGRRTQRIYSITDAGRAELARWLAQPIGKGPYLEFEGLLRVFLAPFGRDENLLATLEQVRAEISGLGDLAERVRAEYLRESAPFQRYAPTRAMVHDFLYHFARLVDDWAARSLAQAARWPKLSDEKRTREALSTFKKNTEHN